MAGLGAFLTLVVGATAVAAVLGAVGGLVMRFVLSGASADRPVMPSHYASLLQTDPSNYPGYCTECDTANDPEYSVCRNCSSRLPTTRSREPDEDLGTVMGSDR